MATGRRYESGPDATIRATEEALTRATDARAVVLVEGISDQIAVEVLADRLDRDLEAVGVVVVPIGGAHAVRKTLADFAGRPTVRLSGLVDRAETQLFVAAAPESSTLTPDRIHVCDADLEEELIRAMDPGELEALLEAAGDLAAFRTLQKQTGWRDRPFAEQLHRWMRAHSGRPNRYAELILCNAQEERLPAPLVRLVETA